MIRDQKFIDGVIEEKAARLGHAPQHLAAHLLRPLVVDNKDHADQVYARAADILGVRHVFLAHADVPKADEEIERFRTSEDQGILVAVRKITEGFDCPDVCVLTYLGLWRAPLFISQMACRAMRVTKRERELAAPIPATVIIPNIKELKAAFATSWSDRCESSTCPPSRAPDADGNYTLYMPAPAATTAGQDLYPVQLPWRYCVCRCNNCGLPSDRVYAPEVGQHADAATGTLRVHLQPGVLPDIELLSGPELSHINVDGHDVDLGLVAAVRDQAKADGLDEVHADSSPPRYRRRWSRTR